MTRRPDIFADLPTVYAVGKNYIIIVPVNEPCLMWVRVGDEEFYDDFKRNTAFGAFDA